MSEPLATHTSTPAELQERLAAERDGLPFVVFRDDTGSQRILPLRPEQISVTIGRRPDNGIALDWDTRVSRLHAVIELVGGDWTIADDGLSQNGTWLGQDRITGRRRLVDGDVVRIGATQLLFRDPRAASALGSTVLGNDETPTIELTPTQRRVLVALCEPYRGDFGHPATNQAIADELAYSVDAVKTHLRTLFGKFAIGDVPQNQKRMQLADRALRFGIVTERDYRT
jgi:pSer/pThr/pTyr-binding forkhead associated (FHA) protein